MATDYSKNINKSKQPRAPEVHSDFGGLPQMAVQKREQAMRNHATDSGVASRAGGQQGKGGVCPMCGK